MFSTRKNYLPSGEIYKDGKTGKYFIESKAEHSKKGLVTVTNSKNNPETDWAYKEYGLVLYDTIKELMDDLYEVAKKRHVDSIYKDITYSKGIKV
jgi:hypothetical protein